ncbi:nucleoside-diphosphate kinase, partial [Streptococcus pneumoniae]|nr:nucleoside-diphosphate kinase [Streptococcus pneumoniae]
RCYWKQRIFDLFSSKTKEESRKISEELNFIKSNRSPEDVILYLENESILWSKLERDLYLSHLIIEEISGE